jgi:hypothetical protein
MKIDITPQKKLATDLGTNIALDIYKNSLYSVEDESGKQVCCVFDPQDLASFQPNRTVSEMMQAWTTDDTGKLTFVEYIYNIDLKSDILYGKNIPVIAKKGMLGLYEKGDKLSLRSILYNKDTLLVNALVYAHNKDWSKSMLTTCPDEMKNSPLGATVQHPNNPEVYFTKAHDEVIAPKGSYKSMELVLPNGSISMSIFGSIPIADLFEKVKA